MGLRRKQPGASDTARLFSHGGSQAVRLPKAYRFEGEAVAIRREGDRVILEPVGAQPVTKASLAAFWARIDALRDPVEEFPSPPVQETAAPPRPW